MTTQKTSITKLLQAKKSLSLKVLYSFCEGALHFRERMICVLALNRAKSACFLYSQIGTCVFHNALHVVLELSLALSWP